MFCVRQGLGRVVCVCMNVCMYVTNTTTTQGSIGEGLRRRLGRQMMIVPIPISPSSSSSSAGSKTGQQEAEEMNYYSFLLGVLAEKRRALGEGRVYLLSNAMRLRTSADVLATSMVGMCVRDCCSFLTSLR